MHPRISLLCSLRACRPRPTCLKLPIRITSASLRVASRRHITADEKPLPVADQPGPGPNQEQLPHASEEAAAIGKITGDGGPELDRGTPVQEILKRDPEAQRHAPEVLKNELESSVSKGSRAYSTVARRQQTDMISFEDEGIEAAGHIYGLPELPLQKYSHLKNRDSEVIRQVTNLLMRHGKLSKAQTNMAIILNHLRTTPPPAVNPSRPLLPGAPPSSHLPLNPVLYLQLAIDSVAPLLRIRSQKGAAGGGMALQIPIPLGLKQRRRQAVMWILDAASKRRSKGSGKGGFAQKVAEELISIVEGKSGVWDRRGGVHKLGVSARSNLNFGRRR